MEKIAHPFRKSYAVLYRINKIDLDQQRIHNIFRSQKYQKFSEKPKVIKRLNSVYLEYQVNG